MSPEPKYDKLSFWDLCMLKGKADAFFQSDAPDAVKESAVPRYERLLMAINKRAKMDREEAEQAGRDIQTRKAAIQKQEPLDL